MRQVALIVGFSALACVMGTYPSTSGALSSALDYETADQSLVVKIKKNKDDDDDDHDKPKKEKKAKNCKKARCEPGMFVLEKPNIYGACCQATAAPLTPKTAPVAPVTPEKCQFPGEEGTPPNCFCPSDTEFKGYKGCVKKPGWFCEADLEPTGHYTSTTPPGRYSTEAEARAAFLEFRKSSDQIVKGQVSCRPN
jgi:hypothetical protein